MHGKRGLNTGSLFRMYAHGAPEPIQLLLGPSTSCTTRFLAYDTKLPLPNDPYVDALPIIQRIESRLAATYFSQIGSIYYKADVSESLRDLPLYSRHSLTANSARFCIGPIIDRKFWRAGRAALDIDRGPCECCCSLTFHMLIHHLRVGRALVYVCIGSMCTSVHQRPAGSVDP